LIYKKIISRRTTRKFEQKPVAKDLKYVIVNDEEQLNKVFKATRWAGSLPDYSPSDNEAPTAYVAILLDKNIRESPGHDAGIAAMSISMVAFDEGIASCMLGGIDRVVLRTVLKVPERLDVLLLVALGYAAEKQVVDEAEEGNIKYWLDKNGVIHVPKRPVDEILRWNAYVN
jgi:nitroreductase